MEKMPFDWNEDDLQRIIDNKIKESSSLEYKRCDSLKGRPGEAREKIIKEISKDVSSFANAEGGSIVYGIIEENRLPKAVDEGFEPETVKREWLEDVIDSNVKPKITGLKIKQIELMNSHPGKVIYIVYIPQSLQGAIQANDYRYYQRRNFKAEPMEDYQVRDVMNRFKHPLLIPEISYKKLNPESEIHEYGLILNLKNDGVVTARIFGFDMLFPNRYDPKMAGPTTSWVRQFNPDRPFEHYKGIKFRNSSSNGEVLFPGEINKIFGIGTNLTLTYKVNMQNWEEVVRYRIYITTFADDMPPHKYEYPFESFQKF